MLQLSFFSEVGYLSDSCEALSASLASQLYRASALFETIRHEAQHSTDYKLSLFDLQTSSYQALQRVLVSLGTTSCHSLLLTLQP